MSTPKRATDLGRVNATTARGNQRLYRCDPPFRAEGWGDAPASHEYVVVSAAVVPFSGPETYIFPADAEGNVTDYLELDGSYRGALDHERALANAGYAVVAPAEEPT